MSHGRRPTQVRVSDLADLGVAIAWHEAVALVRVAAQLVMLDPHASPDASSTWLHEDGTLHLERHADEQHGGHRPSDVHVQALAWPPPAEELDDVLAMQVERDGALTPLRTTPGGLVTALASMLGVLLPPSAPEGLQALADPERPAIREATPGTYVDALSFFARPDDDAELRALATRAMAARESIDRTAALRELTERARAAPPRPVPPDTPSRRSRSPALVGAAIGMGAVSAVGAWLLLSSSGTSQPEKTPPVARTSAPPVAPPLLRPPTGERRAAVPRPERRPAPAARGPYREASPPEPESVGGPSGASVTSVAPDIGAPVEASLASNASMPPDGPSVTPNEPGRVYDATDREVTPPTPSRAQLPERQIEGIPSHRLATLELIVDERGAVTRATLVPESARVHDRMMLSAAKTWRFAAARRGGAPVRYRLRMPITW